MNDYCNSVGFCSGLTDQLTEWLPASSVDLQHLDSKALPSPFQKIDVVDKPTLDYEGEPSCSRRAPSFSFQTGPAHTVHEFVLAPCDQIHWDLSQSEGLACLSIPNYGSWEGLVDVPWSLVIQDRASISGTQLGCPNEYSEKPGPLNSQKESPEININEVFSEENLKVDIKHDDFGKHHRPLKIRSIMERKRRNRINKKIATLHDLIPNASKRDKASMLHDTVEYMKSLQLQLQAMPLKTSLCSACSVPMSSAHLPQCSHFSPLLGQAMQDMNSVPFPQLVQPFASGASFPPGIYFSPFAQPYAPLSCRLLNPSQYQHQGLPIQAKLSALETSGNSYGNGNSRG